MGIGRITGVFAVLAILAPAPAAQADDTAAKRASENVALRDQLVTLYDHDAARTRGDLVAADQLLGAFCPPPQRSIGRSAS